MSDDLISRAAAIAACELFDAPVSKSNWVNAQATAAQQIRGAIRALPGTPTPSDTGADSGPGPITPQPGEAPGSDAPALPTHYGAARIQTVQRDFGALRHAIRAHNSEAAETAWDRCERWLGLWPLEQTTPPAPAPSTPVDNKISADPVGKEG